MNDFGKNIGLRGGFVILRTFWDAGKGVYDNTEQSWDGETWEPWDDEHNTAFLRYVGGPKDGQSEW